MGGEVSEQQHDSTARRRCFSQGGKGKVALCTIQHFQALKYHADVLYISATCHPQVPS